MSLTLTACGGGARSAEANKERANRDLLSRSLQLFKDAPSVRVSTKAAVAMGGLVEISVDREKNCSVVAQNEVFRVRIERGGRAWMTWSDAYLNAGFSKDGPELFKGLHGKWLELSQDGKIRKSMVDTCALPPVHEIADKMAAPGKGAYRDAEVTEEGERLTPLRQGDRGNSVTVFAKADGKPYVRKIVVDMPTVAPEPIEFLIPAYGEPVTVTPPRASETVRSTHLEALAEKNLATGLSRT
ncbi:hypothetical protein GO001_24840 [Streptomyces sp. NRRL B-1677]|uniref:hypothetical protein n=1 Tax=Streptomyces TaxID=1883 RepID=UPI0011C40707|nr:MULTISPECIES: hypothetical protein [Streptomyces]MBF6048400.1 hypothetical protein [Streptomyces sp. NRRL B-1677]